MARGIIRQFSMTKVIGAYRSQWKRFWMRLFTFGLYGSKGIGWWRDPERALYNRIYHRTSISIPKLLGYKPSSLTFLIYMLVATATSIVTAPVDIASAATTAHKIKRERKEREATRERTKSSVPKTDKSKKVKNEATSSSTPATPMRETTHTRPASRPTTTTERDTAAEKKVTCTPPRTTIPTGRPSVTSTTTKQTITAPKPKPATPTTYVKPTKPSEPLYAPAPVAEKIEDFKPISSLRTPASEPDENMPKSKPKNENDQYIRKRMMIAGSFYCDKAVLDRLSVGTYIDLVAEPDNPYDKNAVRLDFEGGKIGYVAKSDALPYVTCLKLGRGVYGVITAIRNKDGRQEFEYETWFSSKR